jgi:hypothetical protein
MYHNPNAKFPVLEELFPNIAHHHFRNGMIESTFPDFHPHGSITLCVASKE